MIIQKYFTCSDLQSASAQGRHHFEVVLDELMRQFMFESWCFTVQSLPCWAMCDSGRIHLVSPLEILFTWSGLFFVDVGVLQLTKISHPALCGGRS